MNGPDQIWAEALGTLERGQRFALATVINVRGSTPREVGAKMIVRTDGQFGTIGGGCGEAEVFRKARLLLDEGRGTRLAEVDLTGDFDQQQIGSCGGIMDVLVDIWSPERDIDTARKLAEAAAESRPASLLTVIEAGRRSEAPVGARAVIDPADEARSAPFAIPLPAFTRIVARTRDALAGLLEIESDGGVRQVTHIANGTSPRVFIDPIVGAQRLIIAGGGHIAQPLSQLGAMLGFHVTVIDDRASFANRERFPDADEIIVRAFGEAVASLSLDTHCYLVSVTRGHAFDEETVRAALLSPCGFVGMIGSRRRVKAMLERLGESGVPVERLNEVHAPLGLDIGAETPEEIALAIMAEIVRERRLGLRDELTLGVKSGRLGKKS
ncbi:MAG TPA: XdhC family protein [Candidatus Binataceae bacterium]|nr:XdhC family protein [Candidatus Binataceae bacterium]